MLRNRWCITRRSAENQSAYGADIVNVTALSKYGKPRSTHDNCRPVTAAVIQPRDQSNRNALLMHEWELARALHAEDMKDPELASILGVLAGDEAGDEAGMIAWFARRSSLCCSKCSAWFHD